MIVTDWEIAPVDHVFPETADDVNVTEPPAQNVVGPLAVIVGTAGIGFTVTTVGTDVEEHDPLETVTL